MTEAPLLRSKACDLVPLEKAVAVHEAFKVVMMLREVASSMASVLVKLVQVALEEHLLKEVPLSPEVHRASNADFLKFPPVTGSPFAVAVRHVAVVTNHCCARVLILAKCRLSCFFSQRLQLQLRPQLSPSLQPA